MANRATSGIPNIETEQSLISRVCQRDQGALVEIYDRFASIVYSIALRVLQEESAAEEVMQEVFLHIWRIPDEYNPQRGPLWIRLALIARNRAISRLRGRKTEASIDNTAPGSCVNCGDPAEQSCKRQEICRAIRLLPAIQRQILDCAFFDALTLGEIAASTGEPITSVRIHLRCALLSLRNAVHNLSRSSF